MKDSSCFRTEKEFVLKPGFLVSLTKTHLIVIYILACLAELVIMALTLTYKIGLVIGSLMLFGWPVIVFRFFLIHKKAVDQFNEETQINRLKFLYRPGAEVEHYDGIWRNRESWQDWREIINN